jgi:hypothetical protein
MVAAEKGVADSFGMTLDRQYISRVFESSTEDEVAARCEGSVMLLAS